MLLQASKSSAVVEIVMKRARYVHDALGASVGNSLMSLLADRLSTTVQRKGIMWRSGEDRLCLALMYAREMPEVMRLASYMLRTIEDEPLEAGGYRFHMTAEANIRFCPPSFEYGDDAADACPERGRDAALFLAPVDASVTLAAINRIPVHVGRAPARISIWGPHMLQLATALKLPRQGQIAVEVATRVLGRDIALPGSIVWASESGEQEYEYGIELSARDFAAETSRLPNPSRWAL